MAWEVQGCDLVVASREVSEIEVAGIGVEWSVLETVGLEVVGIVDQVALVAVVVDLVASMHRVSCSDSR